METPDSYLLEMLERKYSAFDYNYFLQRYNYAMVCEDNNEASKIIIGLYDKLEPKEKEIRQDVTFLTQYCMFDSDDYPTTKKLFLLNSIVCMYNDNLKHTREYFVEDNEQPTPPNMPQQITIPNEVLEWLQENGFIEDATTMPYTWLKTKQLARELLTHPIIKDSLTVAEVERQAPTIFNKKGRPLNLAKNKRVPSIDSDNLRDYLATL